MSGGHYDYAYSTVLNFADDVERDLDLAGKPDNRWPGEVHPERDNPELRRAFVAYLRDVIAPAMKAIEWNDSGDGADDESDLLNQALRLETDR